MITCDIQCACGACVISIDGEPNAQFYCHCRDCQRATGGPFNAVAVFSADAVRLQRGELDSWTLRTLPRHRCRVCGTQMTATVEPGVQTGVKANLIPRGQFTPAFHINCQDALLPVVDDLPHYRGFPEVFGGSDERVAW